MDIGIIYCAPHDEFRRRFPALAPTIQYGDEGAHTDFNIYAGTGADARLDEIRFDGVALEDLLAEEGIEFANEAAAIMRMPAPDAAVQLRSVLDKLFARHTAT
ncbi:hypothetical protein ACFVSU_10645 [Microbacterium sp. NPDC058062]|uniref:hypothetical protein n=1 Tax=Microbacterium sp. NPDC058062 TaxID=3346320 RepID=UPI0036DBDA41